MSLITIDHYDNPLRRAMDVYLSGYAPDTQRTYASRLKVFMGWYTLNRRDNFIETIGLFLAYLRDQRQLAPRTIQNYLNAIRGMVKTAAVISEDDRFLRYLAQMALVKAPSARGQVQGKRLTVDQAMDLLAAPDTSTPKGMRDKAIFGLMLLTGMRRSEICNLRWAHIQMLDGYPVIANLKGKHGRTRTMKLKGWLYDLLLAWGAASGRGMAAETRVFVPISRGGRVLAERDGFTTHAVYALLLTYVRRLGLPEIRPHDLRRTAALLSRRGGATIEQVQLMLGHASPQTTSHYIGEGLDLHNNAVDFNPL